MTFSDLFAVGISAKTLGNMNLELENQVSVTESHPFTDGKLNQTMLLKIVAWLLVAGNANVRST